MARILFFKYEKAVSASQENAGDPLPNILGIKVEFGTYDYRLIICLI